MPKGKVGSGAWRAGLRGGWGGGTCQTDPRFMMGVRIQGLLRERSG